MDKIMLLYLSFTLPPLLHSFPVPGMPHSSDVRAYVDNGIFSGVIMDHETDDSFHIEPAYLHYDSPSFTHIIYRQSDLIFNFTHDHKFEGNAYQKLYDTQVCVAVCFV